MVSFIRDFEPLTLRVPTLTSNKASALYNQLFSKREQQQTHALEKKIQNLESEHEQAIAQLQEREKELLQELNQLKEEKK